MMFVRAAVLGFLGLWEEAGKIVEVLISSQTTPAGPVADEGHTLSSTPLDANLYAAVRFALRIAINFGPTLFRADPVSMDPAQFRQRFYPGADNATTFNVIPPAQKYDLTMTIYKKLFPLSASEIMAQKLAGETQLMPSSFIPAADVLRLMASRALLQPTPSSLLLAKQLWCLLGEIYVAQGKLHQAELCAHEAFLQSELDSRIYALKGLILEQQGRWSDALECYQLGMQMQECSECRLGCARCYLQLDKTPHHLQLAWHAGQRALRVDPGNARALVMVGEIGRKLGGSEPGMVGLHERAIQLEAAEPILPASLLLDLLVASLVQQ